MDGSSRSVTILTIDQLNRITSASDAMQAVRSGLADRGEDYCIRCVEVVTRLCESDVSGSMAEQLGSLGMCSLLDQILGLKIASPNCCESCLRAMCSLLTSGRDPSLGNADRLSVSGILYRVVKTATAQTDRVLLEWGLRIICCLCISLESKDSGSSGVVSRLVSCGGCDLLVKSLDSEATRGGDPDLVTWTVCSVLFFIYYYLLFIYLFIICYYLLLLS